MKRNILLALIALVITACGNDSSDVIEDVTGSAAVSIDGIHYVEMTEEKNASIETVKSYMASIAPDMKYFNYSYGSGSVTIESYVYYWKEESKTNYYILYSFNANKLQQAQEILPTYEMAFNGIKANHTLITEVTSEGLKGAAFKYKGQQGSEGGIIVGEFIDDKNKTRKTNISMALLVKKD